MKKINEFVDKYGLVLILVLFSVALIIRIVMAIRVMIHIPSIEMLGPAFAIDFFRTIIYVAVIVSVIVRLKNRRDKA